MSRSYRFQSDLSLTLYFVVVARSQGGTCRDADCVWDETPGESSQSTYRCHQFKFDSADQLSLMPFSRLSKTNRPLSDSFKSVSTLTAE